MPAGGRGARVTTAGLASARHFDGHLPLHGAVLESPAALGHAGLAAHFTSQPVLQSLPPDARGRAYVSLILAANVGCF